METEAAETEEAYVSVVICSREEGPMVEYVDFDGGVRRYTADEFLTEFASAYDHADLSYTLGQLPVEQCSCCLWGDA